MKWSKALRKLLDLCKEFGIRVVFVKDATTRDYLGMNTKAAKSFGLSFPEDTIYVDKNLSTKVKYYTLKHELDEFNFMKEGASYWKAHVKALKTEKEVC